MAAAEGPSAVGVHGEERDRADTLRPNMAAELAASGSRPPNNRLWSYANAPPLLQPQRVRSFSIDTH